MLDNVLIYKIFITILLITLFYNYIKSYVLIYAGKIACRMRLTRFYSFEKSKGVVELPLIVLLHFIFCLLVVVLSGINVTQLGITIKNFLPQFIYGLLLGVGVMGLSSLLGRLFIEYMRYFFPGYFPSDIKNWLAMSRSGWIRHHFHTLEVLPVPLALSVTLGQVCAEEIVFRGVLINYFLSYGQLMALTISVSLFMYMQIFHMPNRVASVFPMIGALVMGIVGGILYIKTHLLIPLIIAHITFFSIAVL